MVGRTGPSVDRPRCFVCCPAVRALPLCACAVTQVVGFHSGYHAMSVMATGAKLANCKRLAQVCGIRLALQDSVVRPDGEPGQVFMQLDGEPWVQKVPPGNAAAHIVVSMSCHRLGAA